MRIWTPVCSEKRYFLTLYFRETGQRHFLRVGRELLSYGKGPEHMGKYTRVQVEVTDGEGSIELFPGAKILGVVLHTEAGIDERYQTSLNPQIDEVELVKPSDVVVVSGGLAKEIAGDNQQFRNQLEVLNGKRRRFIGK